MFLYTVSENGESNFLQQQSKDVSDVSVTSISVLFSSLEQR